ncbi:SANT/Myb_domain [Hexamita inflata]|uniref:SANT/Myb domain n=1 Tax=Hexamita inflata TaxID=28002 RepID=A0AA86NNN3_9EUKA|nr:SANT/Myb domain [Hexamita inflata]
MSYSSKLRWSEEEEAMFQLLLAQFQNNFREVAKHIQTRSYGQVRSHFYNLQNRQSRSQVIAETPRKQTLTEPPKYERMRAKLEQLNTAAMPAIVPSRFLFNEPSVIKQTPRLSEQAQMSEISVLSMFATTE